MNNSILILILSLTLSIHSFSQDVFQTATSKMLFFSSFDENVDYIVICERESLNTVGGMRNVPFSNPHTFFAPGDFIAIGVSMKPDGTYTVITDPFIFDVTDRTVNLNAIEF